MRVKCLAQEHNVPGQTAHSGNHEATTPPTLIGIGGIYCKSPKGTKTFYWGEGGIKLREMLFGQRMLSHITVVVQMFGSFCRWGM